MNVRRSAAVLAATAVLGTAAPAVAASPSPSPSVVIPEGLYGSGDPTYDGVWRQSLALMAQHTVGVDPAEKALTWLVGQQCANGAFPAFRADTTKACDAKVMVDTNSTAVAVQALSTLTISYDAQVKKAVTWLKSVQNKDGGWGYTAGGASDANSTSVVIGALAEAGVTVPNLHNKEGRTPGDALLKLALPCDGPDAGAFAYQPDKKGKLTANADATAAAVLGAYGETLVGSPQDDAESPADCKQTNDDGLADEAGDSGAAWLAKTLAKDGYLKSVLPGAEDQPDYSNTADAVVALSSAGFNDQAAASLRWLEGHALKWAEQSGPAAYAQLILATDVAKGGDVHDFGGKDLVTLLNATGPTPERINKLPTASASTTEASDENDGALTVAWTVGGGLLLGSLIGSALMLRGRKRRQ